MKYSDLDQYHWSFAFTKIVSMVIFAYQDSFRDSKELGNYSMPRIISSYKAFARGQQSFSVSIS